jgi:succinyl-CoA synthetase beta subunit
MRLFEHEAKSILKKFGVPFLKFGVAHDLKEVETIIDHLNLSQATLKLVSRTQDSLTFSALNKEQILNKAYELLKMATQQDTRHKTRLILQENIPILDECALKLQLDPKWGRLVLFLKHKEEQLQYPIDVHHKLTQFHLNELFQKLELDVDEAYQLESIVNAMIKGYRALNCKRIVIPNLARNKNGFFALNCIVELDPNALDRQEEMCALFNSKTQSLEEAIATQYRLEYFPLQGTIAPISNSRDFGLAVIDILEQMELHPAHFLILPTINLTTLEASFRLIKLNPKVKAFYIHFYCKKNAKGALHMIEQVKKEYRISVPVVVHLEGVGAKEAVGHHPNTFCDMKLSLKTLKEICSKE